jgi:hypothetical protein
MGNLDRSRPRGGADVDNSDRNARTAEDLVAVADRMFRAVRIGCAPVDVSSLERGIAGNHRSAFAPLSVDHR